jgi:hypothetical protein
MIDGKEVGAGKLPVTIPLNLGLGASVVLGADTGAPVMLSEDYKPPFAFTGTVKTSCSVVPLTRLLAIVAVIARGPRIDRQGDLLHPSQTQRHLQDSGHAGEVGELPGGCPYASGLTSSLGAPHPPWGPGPVIR